MSETKPLYFLTVHLVLLFPTDLSGEKDPQPLEAEGLGMFALISGHVRPP